MVILRLLLLDLVLCEIRTKLMRSDPIIRSISLSVTQKLLVQLQ